MADKDEDDEFDFSDNDLDGLPDNALRELETSAILLSQHGNHASVAGASSTYSRNASRERGKPGMTNAERYRANSVNQIPHPPSSDYGFEDEVVIDLDEEPMPLEHGNKNAPIRAARFPNANAQWAPIASPRLDNTRTDPGHAEHQDLRSGQRPHGVNGARAQAQAQYTQEYAHDGELDIDNMEVDEKVDRQHHSLEQLQSQIRRLEQEKLNLLKSVEEAQSTAMSKAGEIAIVRRNHDKAAKEYERRIAIMQQAHADVIAKQKAELEKTRRDRELVETNNMFLEHDLAREAEKAKRVKKAAKDVAGQNPRSVNASPTMTPKKQKNLPFRDGFDDEDIVMLSPSKLRDRAKGSTPKQGGKRKRTITDQSPVQPLELSQPRERPKEDESSVKTELVGDLGLSELIGNSDERFQMLQRFISHRSPSGDRLFEALTKYSFPSKPDKLLSSIVYDGLLKCSFSNARDLSFELCGIFLELWDKSLKEQFYAPLYLLIDAVQFLLACEKVATAIALTERSVPLILAAVDLVAIPIAKASTSPKFVAERDDPAQVKVREQIDVFACLELLHDIATSCATSPEAVSQFWHCMPNDFVLLMLMKAQPLSQILLMLRILSTSVLPSSIGAIVRPGSAPDKQPKNENDTIERVVWLLFEFPETLSLPEHEDRPVLPYASTSICDLRLQVLRVLGAMCVEDHGSLVLARHRHCIGRLVRFLHDQIDSLYDHNTQTHSRTVESINVAMRLLYHLVTTFPEEVDMKAKLNVVPGGSHKHLVALTRLAFSDALVLEEGIEGDVIDAAHELLDEYLSPEEGEALLQVFSSARSAG